MRHVLAMLAFFAVLPAAANVCTWKGASGGRWSVSSNWDVVPVAGRGDVLVFENAAPGTALRTQNDLANLRLSGLRFLGTRPVSVFGDPIVFGSGTCTITNTCPVTNSCALTVNDKLRVDAVGSLRLEGATTISGTGSLTFRGKGAVQVAGEVNGPEASLVNSRGDSPDVVDFRAPVHVGEVRGGTGYGELRFSATGNSWNSFRINPLGTFGAGGANTLPSDMVLVFADAYRENRSSVGCLRLNGWDQTIDRISSSTNAYKDARRESDHVRSDFAATLTLRGTADATTWCKVWDHVSLCWNPLGNYTQTFMDRDHDMRGRIVVSNGTFRVAGCATFRNVEEIEVAPGARFVLDGASTNALSSLRCVTVGAGGTFDVSSFATPPFAPGEVAFSAAPGAVLNLPAGYTTNLAEAVELLSTDFGTASRRFATTNATVGSSFTGVLPQGWEDNFSGWSAADCTAERLVENGTAFLRFRRNGNTVQFRHGLGLLDTPATFRVTMTFRSRAGCQLGLREDPSPYTTYASTTCKSFYWTTVTNVFTVEKSLTTNTGLYLYPGSDVTDVKEIRLCRVPASAARPVRPAVDPARVEYWNQRRFPFDGPAGWNLEGAVDASIAADSTHPAPDGVPSLRLSASANSTFYAPPMQTAYPDHAHALTFRYRSTDSWSVTVRGVDNTTTHLSNRTLPAAADWQTAVFTVGPRSEDEGLYVLFSGSGALNLDAPSLRLGRDESVPATGPEAVVACGPGDAAPARIQFDDEPALGRWAAIDAPAGSTLRLRVTDLYGDETALPDIPLTGGKTQSGTFSYAQNPARPYGQFRVEAWIEHGGTRVSAIGETVLTRLPRPVHWGEDGPRSPFGTHLLAQVDQLVAAKACGVNWTRFHDAGTDYSGWYHLEQQPGVWTWPDAAINLIRAWHVKPFAQLGTAPTWATRFADLDKDPGGYFRRYLRPVDLSNWTNYVSRYVARYAGKVDDYFIWNEPWGGWWKTAADADLYDPSTCESAFAELCRTAYLAAKAANLSSCVSGYNTTSGNTDWGRKLTQAGAFDFCDAIDYHFYTPTARAMTADEIASNESCLAPIRAVHPDLGGKPVIMSEGQANSSGTSGAGHRLTGLYRNVIPFAPETEHDYRSTADNTARYLVSQLVQGDARVFLYSMHCHTCLGKASSYATLVGEDGFPHPMLVAHAAVARRLEGATFLARGAFGEVGAFFAFRGSDGTTTTYLSGLSETDAQALAARTDVAAADIFGNSLSVATWHPDELVSVTGARIEVPKESLVYVWTGASGSGSWNDGGNWTVNAGEATDHGPVPGAAIRFNASATVTSGTIAFGEGSTIEVADGATATLRIPIAGSGTVGKGGAGTLDLAGEGASFAGTLDVTGGVVRISGREPLGPCTVKARALAPIGRICFAGAETAADFVLTDGWGGSDRTSLTFENNRTNVVTGSVTGTVCTFFDLPSKARLVLDGGCQFNYANMSVHGTLVVTNRPFRSGTMQGYWEHVDFWTTENKMTSVNGWHATYSPQPMTANVDFHVDGAFDDSSMLCSVDGVWDLHGTTQRIGSFNSIQASSRIRSFDGPARLEINQTGKWKEFATRGSPTGIEDFTFCGAFEGETSLRMTGTSKLVLTGVSTATGSVEVAGGTLVFTNGASWRTATNVVVRGTGRICVHGNDVFGAETVLRVGDSAGITCGRNVPGVLTVRELWVNGAQWPAGWYGSPGDVDLPAICRLAFLGGDCRLRVRTGPGTLFLIR